MSTLGSVKEFWRFPIKSMLGERLESAVLDSQGMLGDRAFALLDIETNQVVTAKSLRRFPGIFDYRAEFSEEPEPGRPLPPVTVELPSGEQISTRSGNFDEVLSESLGQAVRLVEVGEHEPIPYHDACPISVLTESTLLRLRELEPESDFDVRRFRMNIIVQSHADGFVENDWIGLGMNVGNEVQLEVIRANGRCVMTTLVQEDLPADKKILITMVKHNRLDTGEGKRYPCAGIYANVKSGGRVNVGDLLTT